MEISGRTTSTFETTWSIIIADLAKSTFTLNAEGVYQGPADRNDKLQWNVPFKPTFSLLHANYVKRWIYSFEVMTFSNMTIDMGVVKNPE